MPTQSNDLEEYLEKLAGVHLYITKQTSRDGWCLPLPPPFSRKFWKLRSQILNSEVLKFDRKKSFLITFVCCI